MNRPRPNRVSICAGAAPRPWRLSQTAAALFLLLVAPAMPAAAQATGGGPAPPNTGPDYLPSPQSGFGVPSPIQAPSAASPNPAPGPEQAPSLRLPPPGAGITPLQQNQPAAPAILIQPRASVGETLTDNVFNTATDRVADLETQLIPGLSISADTPRLQGVLTGQLEYDMYLRETEEDQLFGNLYANGTVTAIQDHLFLDAKSDLTQAPELGAGGFAPLSQLPKSQLSQVFTNYVSPYFRESYGGLADAELRYSFASTNFGGNTGALQEVAGVPSASALSNSVSNNGTLRIATGSDFERLLSRLTITASNVNAAPGSVIPNTDLSVYDDLEYRVSPLVAGLGRLGYENIRYPFAPAATATGVLWQVGGRLGLGPGNQYVSLRYGKEQGIYGATGSLRYEITPATIFTATAVQGVESQQAEIQSSLAGSSLDTYGRLVDQYDLPTAFINPEFALQNNVYRS